MIFGIVIGTSLLSQYLKTEFRYRGLSMSKLGLTDYQFLTDNLIMVHARELVNGSN